MSHSQRSDKSLEKSERRAEDVFITFIFFNCWLYWLEVFSGWRG